MNWWVVNQLSRPGGPRAPQQTNYEVVQSRSRPVNTVAGPFPSQSAAQAWQTSANTAGNSPGSAIGGIVDAAGLNPISGVSDLAHRLTESSTWIRVGEFIAGAILLYVGAKAFFPTTVNNITGTAKAIGKGAAIGAI